MIRNLRLSWCGVRTSVRNHIDCGVSIVHRYERPIDIVLCDSSYSLQILDSYGDGLCCGRN
jgi:hypothetical protein